MDLTTNQATDRRRPTYTPLEHLRAVFTTNTAIADALGITHTAFAGRLYRWKAFPVFTLAEALAIEMATCGRLTRYNIRPDFDRAYMGPQDATVFSSNAIAEACARENATQRAIDLECIR